MMTLTPYDLRTEMRAFPREIDVQRPRFAWRLRSDRNNDDQQARRIIVVAERDGTAVWDSGWIRTDEVVARYDGVALTAFTSYRWELTVESRHGDIGMASGAFETGALSTSDWSASWIGRSTEHVTELARVGVPFARSWVMQMAQPTLRVRHEFSLTGAVVRARLFATAHGVYRAYVNGQRAGEDELAPGWTDYRQRIQYQSHDVTSLLHEGQNVIGMLVGEGWWSGCVGYDVRRHGRQYGSRPHAFAQLIVDMDDGTRVIVATDEHWSESVGELVYDDLLMGEAHDLTLADPEWCTVNAQPVASRPAVRVEAKRDVLVGQRDEPVRVVDRLGGTVIDQNADRIIIDFGQNMVGRVSLQIDGVEPRSPIRIRHGEILDENGEVYTDNLRSAEATDIVVPATTQVAFEPMFTFHGFRYAEVTGVPSGAQVIRAEGVVLSSAMPDAGVVTTSSQLLNQLLSNIRWGQKGNFVSVPTDCPQRDERLGWTADAQVFAPTAAYNSDVHAFFDRWLLDLRDAQRPNGSVPDVVPVPPSSDIFDFGAAGWGDAATVIPWHMYRTYGDLELLSRQYPSMIRWVDYVSSRNPDGLWTHGRGNDYGDWLGVGEETPRELVATAYRIRSLDITVASALALGRDDDAARLAAQAATCREAFVQTFVTDGRLRDETQSAYLFAIAWQLVPAAVRSAFGSRLAELIRARGTHLTTGFLGVGLIGQTLCEIGETQLAYDLLFQTEYPSWGYSITQGATTIWERWDGWTDVRGFQAHTMNSFNHYSLGSVGEWIFESVAGISQTPDSIGFRLLRISPKFDERLDEVDGTYESPRGRVRVHWQRVDGRIEIEVEIPPGSTAIVGDAKFGRELSSGRHSWSITTARGDRAVEVPTGA